MPTYLFSSGYGDVVAHALVQGLYGDSDSSGVGVSGGRSGGGTGGRGAATATTTNPLMLLPQNLRVISNFFRAAPDGTVRAFSKPIVHER